jgi:hypothetical protein
MKAIKKEIAFLLKFLLQGKVFFNDFMSKKKNEFS